MISSLPWSQETFFGYVGLIMFGVLANGTYTLVNTVCLTFFIGICKFHGGFSEFYRYLVEKLDKLPNKSIDLHLWKIIRFQISVKE